MSNTNTVKVKQMLPNLFFQLATLLPCVFSNRVDGLVRLIWTQQVELTILSLTDAERAQTCPLN